MAISGTLSIGLIGLRAFLIQVQAFISPGLPYFSIIGLPDASLSEARERVKSACTAAQIQWPSTRVTVNLSPASLPKRGSSHDLAIAMSVMSAHGVIPHDCLLNTVVIGELNLDGTVLPITGLLPLLLHAKEQGFVHPVLPRANREEADLVPDIDPIYVSHIGELIEYYGGNASYTIPDGITYSTQINNTTQELGYQANADMSEVINQESAKQALEIAAAGGHHVLMVGPPGTGKTMLASRMPSIMCPLDEEQQFEIASIRSICGTLSAYGISDVPPFEAPHHTASVPALVGGGTGIGKPGAVTRAHHGILFLDEAPEFSPHALQTLREPLESGNVAVSRSKATTYYPARFQLIMAANPCPCGYAYGTGERCTCSERERIRYFGRLSGPILDRIDIQVDVDPVEHLGAQQEHYGASSDQIRARVCEARAVARRRFREFGWHCNAQASGSWLRKYTSHDVIGVVNRALASHTLSLRGADRAMRIAWTLADLQGRTSPNTQDIAMAIALRTKEIS